MSDSAPPVAAWYPDPEDPDQLRYWDGTAWTEHRAPVVYKKSPLWWIIPVVAFVVIVGVVSTVNGVINGTDPVTQIHPGTEQRCLDNVLDYAPYADVDGDLRLFMFTPVSSWDKTVTCLLFRVEKSGEAQRFTGTVKD